MIAFIPNKGEYLGVQDEPDRQEQDDTDQKGVRFAGSGQGTNTMIDPGTPRGSATPQTIVDRGRKEQSESPRSRLPQAQAGHGTLMMSNNIDYRIDGGNSTAFVIGRVSWCSAWDRLD